MTSMAVTHATGSWREAMHWKRRGERLLRASGLPATIIRPGEIDAALDPTAPAVADEPERFRRDLAVLRAAGA